MNADSDADPAPLVRILEQCSLDANPPQHSLFGVGEGDHEAVALRLDDVPAVLGDKFLEEPVVSLQELHPVSIAQLFVVDGGVLDVGEGDHHIAVGGQPGEVGTLYLRPSGQIFDRVTDGGANAFGDQ